MNFGSASLFGQLSTIQRILSPCGAFGSQNITFITLYVLLHYYAFKIANMDSELFIFFMSYFIFIVSNPKIKQKKGNGNKKNMLEQKMSTVG